MEHLVLELSSAVDTMGRKKLEIKLIEDKNKRQVTFSKRREGLFKKARQLSALCGADAAVVVFSSRGKLYEYCSGSTNRSAIDLYITRSRCDIFNLCALYTCS